MIQFYFLSVCYIVFSALILLQEDWKKTLSFMILFRDRLSSSPRLRRIHFLAGLVIAALTLAFPVSPGPVLIGDLVPSLTALYLAFLIFLTYSEKRGDAYETSIRTGRLEKIGKAALWIAAIHFLFPSLVLF